MNLDELKSAYEEDLEGFELLRDTARQRLANACSARNIVCRVEARVKPLQSLVKKLLFQPVGQSLKYKKVIDRVGVRVVLTFSDQGRTVEEAVESVFVIEKIVDKTKGLGDSKFGYSGVHYYVRLREPASEIPDIKFEVQVHTNAQSLYASTSHTLLYKPQIQNSEVQRALARIAAVLELVDLEILRVRDLLSKDQDAALRTILMSVEAAFIPLASRNYDRDLTVRVLDALRWMTLTDDLEAWKADFDKFVQDNAEVIAGILDKYKDDFRNPLLSQPESLLILYAQDKDEFAVEEKWPNWLEQSVLASFKGVWSS